jgi:hypothetical protein
MDDGFDAGLLAGMRHSFIVEAGASIGYDVNGHLLQLPASRHFATISDGGTMARLCNGTQRE